MGLWLLCSASAGHPGEPVRERQGEHGRACAGGGRPDGEALEPGVARLHVQRVCIKREKAVTRHVNGVVAALSWIRMAARGSPPLVPVLSSRFQLKPRHFRAGGILPLRAGARGHDAAALPVRADPRPPGPPLLPRRRGRRAVPLLRPAGRWPGTQKKKGEG